ncbi:hypothetical protein [Edaphobacter aggregans]|uniref:hypothetical protein n=1 Tax=Edaphobacter aggregans TaxID=570835 RepID=UPI0012F94319|nr:hypothetical protein [Edaphobacter aggregans]
MEITAAANLNWFVGEPKVERAIAYCQFASDGDDGPIAGLLASARGQVQTPLS